MGMQQQMMMGAGMDATKAYAAELQQMELAGHSTAAMEGFEARAAAMLAALERRGGERIGACGGGVCVGGVCEWGA